MTANEVIAQSKDIRVASQAALQLVSLLDQPTVSNENVVQILRCDNILTAKLLRACNCPYFGLRDEVASVDQAVLLLGHQQILQIVLTLEFSGTMVVPLPGYAVEAKELWHHSLATATAAELICKDGLDVDADPAVAFTAGLLHDIGKILLSQVLTADRQSELRSIVSADKLSRADAERKVLGTDHAEVGAVLLKSWRLPGQIVEAVANHHNPALKPRPALSAVAHLADVSAHLASSAPGREACASSENENIASALQFTPEKLELLVMNVRETFERVNELMRMA